MKHVDITWETKRGGMRYMEHFTHTYVTKKSLKILFVKSKGTTALWKP